MSILNYVISTPGRVGSAMLCRIIQQAKERPNAIWTHDPFYCCNSTEPTCLILLSRKDLFSSIISSCIDKRAWKQINEQVPMVPFDIKCQGGSSEFEEQYRWHKWYGDSHNSMSQYAKIENFWFEDFVNNPEYVYQQLLLTSPDKVENLPTKSKYHHQTVVLNYSECLDRFTEMERNEPIRLIKKSYDPSLPNW